ncbi:hypothetical protein M0R45_011271 [Rubus argutus]|uniref:Uncharacterized protein n=1 Tax=Rubus argutus TaxID=59490 RepID=A0AAW1YAR0_RUBAR
MDGQKSQAKLTRTQSSLLRSSPTIRSSIHSLHSMSSVTEEDAITAQQQYDEEEQKPKNSSSKLLPSGPVRLREPVRTGSTTNSSPWPLSLSSPLQLLRVLLLLLPQERGDSDFREPIAGSGLRRGHAFLGQQEQGPDPPQRLGHETLVGREIEAVPNLQDPQQQQQARPVVHRVRPEPEQDPKGAQNHPRRGRVLQQWRFLRGRVSQGEE